MATNPCRQAVLRDIQEQNVPERMFRFESNVVPEENKAKRTPPCIPYLESFDLKAV